jgi:acyl-CoA synthetase (NDP forming)/RimJ/RimL family protein N-acetyltransferase
MDPPHPAHWECDVVLADGGTAHIRPVRADDAERVLAFHGRLSPESARLRYFGSKPRLHPRLLRRFTEVDQRVHVVLILLIGDRVIAMAMYHAQRPEEGEAEVAFAVEDAHQGRGIGTLLLEHLAAIARENGIRSFRAETLPVNRRMIDVFDNAGFAVKTHKAEGVVFVSFPLEPDASFERAVERREHQAEARSIARMLAPSSVAVIGASPRAGSVGHALFANLVEYGFGGALHPVHPTARSVCERPAVPDVRGIAGPVDLAVICVPADRVPAVVEQCAEKGVHGLVVISAGFAETDTAGATRQRELVAYARAHGMRVIGPNCLGILNTDPEVRLHATFADAPSPEGGIGLMSQSGALGIAALERAHELELGCSAFVSAGNKADVSGNDLLQFFEDDPRTRVIALYLESLGNPRKFSRLARRISRRKPILAVKSGRSHSGARGASSHTAALASPDASIDALFAQAGVVRVDDLAGLLDAGRLLEAQPLPEGRRVAIVGNSGGPGILAADACERAGLRVPELSTSLRERLGESAGTHAALRNPVDLLAGASPESYARALEALLASEEIDAVLAMPTRVRDPEAIAAAIAAAACGARRPLLACFPAGRPRAWLRAEASRVPCFRDPEPAVRALACAARHAEWRTRPEGSVPVLSGLDLQRAASLIEDALRVTPEGGWLEPARVGELLACAGVRLLPLRAAASADEACAVARAMGRPVALKADAPGLLHKSDVGGVRLDLRNDAEVHSAFADMQARLGGRMRGGLVQPMAEPGVEVLVGLQQDPNLGPALLFGLGGIATELLRDSAQRLVPLTDLDAHELVRALRSSPLLFGYRGAPPVEIEALEELLLRVSRLAEALPELLELDLNPVIVAPKGLSVVDARIRVAPYAQRREPLSRRLR